MLAKLEMKLKCEEALSYQMSSMFHGVLMQLLPEEFADYLHQSQLHPYTQHLELKDGEWYWVVSCLNQDAVDVIIHDTLSKVRSFEIEKHGFKVEVVQKKYVENNPKSLMDCFYEEQSSRYIKIHFVTPTAFKRQGKYCFYPNLRCIYQSLMNKYESAYQGEGMVDQDTLEQLCMDSEIVRYDLKSVNFHLEGIRIPAFIGKITIKLSGTQTMANFANLLFQFGMYSGVGIKTALGMGTIKILDEGGKRGDRKTDRGNHR